MKAMGEIKPIDEAQVAANAAINHVLVTVGMLSMKS